MNEEARQIPNQIGTLNRISESAKPANATENIDKELYKAIFESSNDGVLLLDKKGNINDVNRSAITLTGYAREEIIGRNIKFLTSLVTRELDVSLKNFLKRVFEVDGSPYQVEMLSKDGRPLSIEISSRTIKSRGKLLAELIFLKDVTSIRAKDSLLRESDKTYHTYMDRARDGILVANAQGNILFVNKRIEKIYGYPATEISGKNLFKIGLFRGEDDTRLMKMLSRENGKDTYAEEFQILKKNGTPQWIEIETARIKEDYYDVILLSFRDITPLKKLEQQISEVETRFLALAEKSPYMVFITTGGKIVYANQKFEQLMGLDRETTNYPKVELMDFVAPNSRVAVSESIGKEANENEVSPFRCSLAGSGGKLIETILIVKKIKYEGDSAVLCICTDMTNLSRIEEELKMSDNKFRALVENSITGIGVIQNGRYLFVNQRYADMSACKVDDLLGFEALEMVHPDDRDSFARAVEKRNGETAAIDFEVRKMRKDGSAYFAQISFSFIEFFGKKAMVSTVVDISGRKQAEESLKLAEERYHRHFNNVSDIVYSLGLDFSIVDVSPSVESVLGYKPQELIGKKFTDTSLLARSSSELVSSHLMSVIAGEKIAPTEYHFIARDAKSSFASMSWEPLVKNGRVMGAILAAHDVTESKKIEKDLRQSYEKLRNILNQTVSALSATVEMRDAYTAGHQQRVTELATAIAKEVHLPQERLEILRIAGILHDIGKMSIPAEILSKPGKLSSAEFNLIKMHPRIGYETVSTVDFHFDVARIILQHHERLNGSGYPGGLSGEGILPEARILAVADVVEALASHRPYRPAFGVNKALVEISRNRETLYDTKVVEACIKLFHEKRFDFETSQYTVCLD